MALPAEQVRALIAAVQAKLGDGVHVMGERPADLLDLLPVVVLYRRGGNELSSSQSVLGDAPVIVGDGYAAGLDAGYDLIHDVRAAMLSLGAKGNTGPVETPDSAAPAGVRRLTASWTYVTH